LDALFLSKLSIPSWRSSFLLSFVMINVIVCFHDVI
jgi:hypothetical protein